MYRVKVEAISGTKVYAGGKWLRCIGNKSVRVGEMVWTDGCCVYGHNQISQQPLIVTAVDTDEVIPIVVRKEYYALHTETEYELYIFSKGKFKFIKTFVKNYLYSWWAVMINDKKNIFFSSYPVNVGNHTRTTLRATNIDKKGNRYDMLLVCTSYTDEDGHELVSHAYIKIVKNGEVIKNIDPETADPNNLDNIFIENENNWRFFYTTHNPNYYEGGVCKLITNAETFIVETAVDDNPKNHYDPTRYWVHSIAASTQIKYMLHDGYYYKVRFSRYTYGSGGRGRYIRYWFDFYSPENIKIISSEEFNIDSRIRHNRYIAITKVGNNKYLLNFNKDINEEDGFFGIVESGKVTALIPSGIVLDDYSEPVYNKTCINSNFNTIKKSKGLQNRIKELTVIE